MDLGWELVPLHEDEAVSYLDDGLRVRTRLEQPSTQPPARPPRKPRDVAGGGHDDRVPGAAGGEIIPDLWTAAQVAATSIALGSAVASTTRRWRNRNAKLPKGTRMTLTLTPAKGDGRKRTRVVILDADKKSQAEIAADIDRALRKYVHN